MEIFSAFHGQLHTYVFQFVFYLSVLAPDLIALLFLFLFLLLQVTKDRLHLRQIVSS